MRKLLLATTALLVLSALPAKADTVLTLNGPIAGNTVGPQSTSNPCIICGTAAQQPDTMGFNNFSNTGNLTTFNAFSTNQGTGNNGFELADGTPGTPYTVGQLTGILNTSTFNVAIDVNTTGARGETLDSFQVFVNDVLFAHYTGPTVIGDISNQGNGFADWTLNSVDLTGLDPSATVLFQAQWSGASDGAESFFLLGNVTPPIPEPATWAMMLLGFIGIAGMGAKKQWKGFRLA